VKGKLPDTEQKAPMVGVPTAVGLERLRWALSWFDPDADGYDKWKERLMAVHHETGGSDAGLALVEEWSQQGGKYKPGEITRKWHGFKIGGGTTLDAIMRDLPLAAQLARLGAGPGAYIPAGMTRGPVQVVHRTAPAFTFTAVGDLEVRPSEFLIDGLIETDSLGLIFGDPGCGKSFIAADIALSVATGDQFHGRPTKQGAVFFIAGEGHSGLARRFQAWARHRGRGLTGVPMFKSNRAAQFLDAASAQAVADAVDALVSAHGAPRMIVVDTLARNFGPGDENSTSEMGAFVAAMDDLRGRHPGCVVLIVHHSGHGDKQRARGAMALKGAIDFEYRAEKSDDTITLTNTKMKDAPLAAPMAFRLQCVPLADGVSSAALVPTVAPEGRGKLKPNEKVALNAFKAAADEQDGWGNGLHLIQWSEAFLKIHTGTNPDSKRRMFDKARVELVDKGIFSVEHDIYKINGSLPLNSDGLPDFSGFARTNPAVQGGLSGLPPIRESGIRHSEPRMPGIN